ncbi:signal peptidase I [Candidatus Peregrinibacteria bacterium]|nr:signal peptidase I [Candidatus Peregrinibacteria bacterium]
MQTFKPELEYRRPKSGNVRKFFKETGLFIADIFYNAIVIIVLVVLIRSFLISPFRVVGSSMADTLDNKEFILIDKLSYLVGDIERGDPVVFLPPATSKDTPKFEEMVQVKASGTGVFNFSELRHVKNAVYCDGHLLSAFWFCKEKVKPGDLVYYAPQKEVAGSSGKQTNWNLVKRIEVDENTYKQGTIAFEGEKETIYTVRVYGSKGPEYFVKRVIGIPGDTVKIDGGRVYIKRSEDQDFWQIDESFLNSENLNRTYISQKHRQNVYEVPEGHYFVMGDNRNHSNDSRSWLEPITQEAFAFVPENNISGKVLIVLWPINNFRLIESADF